MSATEPELFRTVTFGDLAADVWGVVLGAAQPFLAVGAEGDAEALAGASVAQLDGEAAQASTEPWRVTWAGGELELTPTAAAAAGTDQLCRVRGELRAAGQAREIDCLGRRTARPAEELRKLASLRDVSAWFGEQDGVSVFARRPEKASNHAGDLIEAAVFDPAGAPPVIDPRLSTTYGSGDAPVRMGLELWLGTEDGEEYPRRFAGEAAGAGASGMIEAFGGIPAASTLAVPLRCHSRGQDGAGVYVLVRWR